MNTLTTRKIVLGLLMTLVLAFSVQGTADALTFGNHSSSDGDLRTVYQNQEFTIRVPITPKGAERISGWKNTPSADADGNPVTVTDANRYYNDADNDGAFDSGETTGDYDDAHYYDQEQITITVIGNASIKKVGSHNVPSTRAASLTMYESTHDSYDTAANDQRFSGSITLTLAPTDVGTVVVSVTDSTLAADNRGGAVSGLVMAYTVYVVNYKTTAATALGFATTTIAATGNYSVGRDDTHDSPVQITVTPATDTPVTLEVVEGPGQFYVQKGYTGDNAAAPMSRSSSSRSLETSSNAATGSDAGSNVYLDMRGGTNRVTIKAPGTIAPVTAIFVYGYPTMQIVSGDGQGGATGGRLADPLVVRVRDGKNRGIPMAIVTFSSINAADTNERFLPVPGTIAYVDASDNWATEFSDIANINAPVTATSIYPMTADDTPTDVDDDVLVQTDRSGDAKVYFQLGSTASSQSVSATAAGATATTFRATATTVVSTDAATITIVDGDNQHAPVDEPLDDPLVVLVRDAGGRIVADAPVTFTTNSGELSGPEPGDPGEEIDDSPADVPDHTALFIVVNTDDTGRASVRYNVGDLPGAKQVFSRIDISNGRTRTKTFNVNGRATTPRDDPADDEDDTDPLPLVTVDVPSTVTGTAGGTATLTITAPANARIDPGGLGDTFLRTNVGSFTRSGTTFTSTLTLPDQVADFSLTVFVNDTRHSVTVSVTEAPSQTGILTVRVDPFSGAPGTTATVTITATDSNDQPANVTVNLSATGGTLASSSVSTGTTGSTTVSLARGSTPGNNNYVTASANDYDSVQGRFLITGTQQQQQQQQQQQVSEAGEPAFLEIYDGDDQSGPLNVQLRDALVVEVLDDDDNPVEGVRVGFDVIQGTGRLSPRSARSDESGFAETNFTPTSAGEIIVRARVTDVDEVEFTVTAGDPPESITIVSGDNQAGNPDSRLGNPLVVEVRDEDGDPIEGIRVTFSVTAGGGTLSAETATTNAQGQAQTRLTLGSERAINSVEASVRGVDPVTFNTSIDAAIHVAASNRPVMYWIDGGALYRLAGAKAEKIAESANDIAVDEAGGKVYWTEQTGNRAGKVSSANLDGTGVTVLKDFASVPHGIALDSENGKLYLTNGTSKIRQMNLDGTQFQANFIIGLNAPMNIAVSSGRVYWTEGAGRVRFANVTGNKSPQSIATGTGALGGIAADDSKVYWTEQTGENTGRIRSADLDGSGTANLVNLPTVPYGIDVDGDMVYWAEDRGRIRRIRINNLKLQKVVTGLMAPGAVAVGGENVDTPSQQQGSRDTTTAKSKYDVNGDGTVDNVDAALVAGASGTNNAAYDVNGDGAVNFLDLLLVFDNRDPGAAGAPTVGHARLTAVQVDRIQEQIDLLLATNDRSPAAYLTLQYLQSLIAAARPGKTQLLANYPNPFNPETWIPYELATNTNVKLTIYDAQGLVVRTLELGHQSAGYYTSRDRAAYWDGRNSFGELVASGLYFYQLETDETSTMRKMVILK